MVTETKNKNENVELVYLGKDFTVWTGKEAIKSEEFEIIEVNKRPKNDNSGTYLAYAVKQKNGEYLRGFLNEPKSKDKKGLIYIGTPMKDQKNKDYILMVFESEKDNKKFYNVNITYKKESHKAFLNIPKIKKVEK